MIILEKPVERVTTLVAALRLFGSLNLDSGPWIAGGAARAVYEGVDLDEGSDIDIFGSGEDELNGMSSEVKRMMKLARQTSDHSGSETIKGRFVDLIDDRSFTVQIVRGNYYPTLSDLFKDIDFSVAQFATDGRVIRYTVDAARDHTDRVLRVEPGYMRKRTRPTRLIKYLSKGFTPAPGVMQWSLNLDDPKTTAQNLGLTYGY